MAERRGNPSVEPEHILLALIQQSEGIVPRLFEKLGASTKALMVDLDTKLEKLPKVTGSAAKVAASQRLMRLFSSAEEETRRMGDAYISTEHFLLAMLRNGDGELNSLFKKNDVT